MARVRTAVPNSPVIRNAHLIGAGKKFPNIKDANGKTQWRLSVVKQAEQQKKLPSLNKLLELTLKSTTSLTKDITKTKDVTHTP